jgi:hypothetical protein
MARQIQPHPKIISWQRNLVRTGKIIKIGYGLYAKAKKSSITGEVIPVAPLPTLAKAALERLGVEVVPSTLESEYNAGNTTRVPTSLNCMRVVDHMRRPTIRMMDPLQIGRTSAGLFPP